MRIDFDNVEKVVFEDERVRRLLPEHKHLFDQWMLGVRVPALRQLGRRALLEFLDQVGPKDLERISAYLESQVTTESVDINLVTNINFLLSDCDPLCEVAGPMNLCLDRDGDVVRATLWR